MHKSFASARRVDKGEELTFDLNGQNFTAITDLPGDLLLEWTEVASDPNLTELQQARKGADFLSVVLEDESLARFQAGLRDKKNPITVEQMAEVLNYLMEVYMGRPLDEESPSAPGPSSIGTTSKGAAKSSTSTRSNSRRAAS